MPTATRTFRVFVSSTFEDLVDERDALQRFVFPKLRKLCEENNARFQAIDLRWGVRDEAALDQQTMEICLREIERCQQTGIKPNFIVLLGDRYGWSPLPARIEAREFERILEVVSEEARQKLLWEERQPAGSRGWYRRDENAVPAEYILRPREVSVAADVPENEKLAARELEARGWNSEEHRLGTIFNSAITHLGWPAADPRRLKYEASATHQEILKGLGHSEEDRQHVFAFFGTPVPGTTEDPRIAALKQDLRNKLPKSNIRQYSVSRIPRLCADVRRHLRKVIRNEVSRFSSRDALDLEVEAHEAFAVDRARHFRGRVSVLDSIEQQIVKGESRPLVVHGPSGCGKSAVVARAAKLAGSWAPGAVLIKRFIGVTPDSSSGVTLLSSLCQQISQAYDVSEETPIGFQSQVIAFHDRIARATTERPLILFLDALDQLRADDDARSFTWLRQNLPPHVSLIVSTTEIPAGIANAVWVEVEDFRVDEADEVLTAWFADAAPKRRLQPEQVEKVLGEFAQSESRLPLYLKLAFEEARRWRSFDGTGRYVLGHDVGGMIDVLFNRLSEDSNHGPILVNRSLGFLVAARYGLTEDEMLDVLAADDEAWQDFETRAHHKPQRRQIPVVVWSRLFLDLEPYLNERAAPGGNVMKFYHQQVAEHAATLYLKGDERVVRHAALATYFGMQSHWRNKAAMQANERKITELVLQQIEAHALADLEKTLTDVDFVAAKCAASLVFDLQLDYRDAIAALPEARAELAEESRRQGETARWTREMIDHTLRWNARRDRLVPGRTVEESEPKLPEPIQSVDPWSEERIEQEAKRIRRNPTRPDRLQAFQVFLHQETFPLQRFGERAGFVIQHALNQAPQGPIHEAAEMELLNENVPLLVRGWLAGDIYNPTPALLRTIEAHAIGVMDVTVTSDGQRAVSIGTECDEVNRGVFWDALKVWDLETGTCPRVLKSPESVQSVSLTPDGRCAVSAGWDGTLRVWDLETATCLHLLKGDWERVACVSVTLDRRRAVSVIDDHRLQVWDLETGACLRMLELHPEPGENLNILSVTQDGRRAVSFSEKGLRLKVWDLDTGTCTSVLDSPNDVHTVTLTLDGRCAVSASFDGMLRVWDLETATCRHLLKGHSGSVNCVSVTPDGRHAVSASDDHTLRVWDLETGLCLKELAGHTNEVQRVSVTPDGRRAVSASSDRTIRVWDLERGLCLHDEQGHATSVRSVSVTPDGLRGVSGSGGDDDGTRAPDYSVRTWDFAAGVCQWALEGHTDDVTYVKVTADGRRAISASSDHSLRIWDLGTGECLRVLDGHTLMLGNMKRVEVDVTPDGGLAVVWSGSMILPSSRDVRSVSQPVNPVNPILRSLLVDGGDQAVVVGREALRVWDLGTGVCRRALDVRDHSHINSMSVTQDGRRAISTNDAEMLWVWNLERGWGQKLMTGHSEPIVGLRTTPNGRLAISASDDKTLRVWNLDAHLCVGLWGLESHAGRIACIDITPDGRYAISAGEDKTLRVWELDTGACLAIVHLSAQVTAIAVSLASDRIIAGTSVGEVIQLDTRGWSWSSAEFIDPGSRDIELQLRKLGATCSQKWGPLHQNTLFVRLSHASALEQAGDRREANGIRRDIAEVLLSLDDEVLKTMPAILELLVSDVEDPETIELLVAHLEKHGQVGLIGELKEKLARSQPGSEPIEHENPPISFDAHVADLSRDLTPSLAAWFALTVGGFFVLHGSWEVRAALAGVYGVALAYPVFCIGLWRFSAPGLCKGKERVLAMVGLVLSAPVLWALRFLFYPVDAAWSTIWSEAVQRSVLSISRPFLVVALISLFFRRILGIPPGISRISLLGALVLPPILVPSIVSALALNAALVGLGLRTLMERLWPKTRAQAQV